MSAWLPPSPRLTSPSSAVRRCRAVSSHGLRIKSFPPIAAAGTPPIIRPSSRSCGVATFRRFTVLTAARGNGGGRTDGEGEGEEEKDLRSTREGDQNASDTNYGNGGGTKENKSQGTPVALPLEIRWRDLLNPDPDNLAAVALTGLLALASVQALWQIFFISLAILLAALKYSFIAALLLFIVITLL